MPDSLSNNLALGGLAACAVGLVLGCLAACAVGLALGGLAACAVLGLVTIGIFYALLRKNQRNFQPVGVVSCIYVHPIKSCRGTEVSRAEFAALGITADGIMDR